METQKTIKNIAIVLTCLVGIALIGLNIHQHKQIKKATSEISHESSADNKSTTNIKPGSGPAVPKNTAQKPIPASDESLTVENEAEELAYHLEAAEEELEMVNKQLSEEEAKKAEQRKIQRELQKRYREDPSYKKSMRDSLGTQYADLFKKLNLSPEKLEEFKDLLFEEMIAQQDIYYEYDTDSYATLSKEQREELNQRYMDLHNEYESKKEDLLGGDNYKIYQSYTETQGERYNVNAFVETLDADEKLTETKKEALIEAMHKARKNVVYERTDDDSESSSNMYSEKNIARMLEYQDRQNEAYLQAAGSILTASQLDNFKTYLQKERDQYKLFMEMAALRYGTSSTQKSD